MLKEHPRGLFVAFLTNMGERFGFYTMMAILVLFLQVKYGLDSTEAGNYYSSFYFAIYALSLIGGTLADWSKQYKTIILTGQIIMFFGYVLMAVPDKSLTVTLLALLIISLGNGFFKGNLQAVVGQLYDNEKYAKYRDAAFMIFYMGINVGAFFAPFAAKAIREWWLKTNGFVADDSLPLLARQFLKGALDPGTTAKFQQLAQKVDINHLYTNNLAGFANDYIDVFSRGYNLAFGVAAVAMVISLIVYVFFKKELPSKSVAKKTAQQTTNSAATANKSLRALIVGIVLMVVTTTVITTIQYYYNQPKDYAEMINQMLNALSVGLFFAFVSYIYIAAHKEERSRVVALILVFIVVIFFWMSFHQNGLTLNYFARDFVYKGVDRFTNLFFTLPSILCVVFTVLGIVLMLKSKSTMRIRVIGIAFTIIFGILCYYFVNSKFSDFNPISPEPFQSFNPLFIVTLTPMVMGLFAYLNKRGQEPSTPKKIGIGMIIAGFAFIIMLVGSLHLVSPHYLAENPIIDYPRASPYWLISTYFVLTIAELFLSPMGLSFVSKVAPERFQSLMQGGWLLATAVGNKLLFVGSLMWGKLDLYLVWGVFVVCCFVSALFIFSLMKRLEKATKA